MLLTLLDTGIRCAELAGLDRADRDLAAGRLIVRHGKGNTQRVLPVARRARAALRAYLDPTRPGSRAALLLCPLDDLVFGPHRAGQIDRGGS